MKFASTAAAALGLALSFGAAQAAGPSGYPARPVTIVVPFAPGGGSDNVARLLAAKLTERTKATFLVDNKPGAGTNIGNEFVSRAASDGYTLLLGQVTLAINPFIYKGLRYNVQKDFAPVAGFATSPTLMVVGSAMPAKTVQEFIAYAKAHPGKVNFGSGGTGTSVHLAGELFASTTGTQMVHIPYKGSAPAMTDLIGGNIQAIFDTATSSLPHVAGGKVRALAVTGTTRLPELPNVPTFAEAGLPSFDAPAWYGVLAPAKTPAAIVQYLNGEIQAILNEPATQQQLARLGATSAPGTPEAFGSYIHAESERWSNVIHKANITAE